MDEQSQRVNINQHYLSDEASILPVLHDRATLPADETSRVNELAKRLVIDVRSRPEQLTPLDRFLAEYDLATEEGVLLMCLAESLLRVPDPETADILIADKIKSADWEQHIGNEDILINASTWCLMLTGRLLPSLDYKKPDPAQHWTQVLGRLGEPVIRRAITLAMRIISEQFVMGTTIEKALARAGRDKRDFEVFSYDMLGEAALTQADAETYLAAYRHAINAIAGTENGGIANSISVKLSALSPRFEITQWQRACGEISARLAELALLARQHGVPLTVDAEETERLEMTLAIFAEVYALPELRDWDGLGIAVQCYQKRAADVIEWLAQLARRHNKPIPVRLVKGAYWDSEIKLAQIRGLADYPVFTLKRNTDIGYLANTRALHDHRGCLFPQFATHNARTVAYVTRCFTPDECEFQRLHGMGESLYEALNRELDERWLCRVYAPVGTHETLLPYLIRRLLENGANTSFVHRIADPDVPLEEIIADPLQPSAPATRRHPRIPLPGDLYGATRSNSVGLNFADRSRVEHVLGEIHRHAAEFLRACPIINGVSYDESSHAHQVVNPADTRQTIGEVRYASADMIRAAIDEAAAAWQDWESTPAEQRATILERAAGLLEQHRNRLLTLCILEAGKTVIDAHDEIREAVDFLRYYASECRRRFAEDIDLPGPAGEHNRVRLRGRGVFFCISPWNFPVAIFTGQVAAALAAGNAVLAKPAEQTSLAAFEVTRLLYEAGVPKNVLHFLPGDGAAIAGTALADTRIAGVAFTGSCAVAKSIEDRLGARPGAIASLVAETGGINAMLVDSSAQPEQVVLDVIHSAFNSAGQRCSALRVLYLQEDIADRIIALIIGRMQELVIGEPREFATDIGPVIDDEAHGQLQKYVDSARTTDRLLYQSPVPDALAGGRFVGPAVVKIDHINDLPGEVFGPVLHVCRYASDQLDAVLDQINDSGYGLTLGIQSRITHRAEAIGRRIRAGNVYINRNMVGAVVGVQPFGGCGLSGTGPKAGGEMYLTRFAAEQTISVNTAAVGGNASLLSMD